MTDMPKRVQMRRDRPWRLDHPDALIVARPGPFGNPFTFHDAEGSCLTRRGAVLAFEDWLAGNPWACGADKFEAQRQIILALLPELRGRDLACWCRPDQECHADVLLEMANRPLAAAHEGEG